MFTLLQRFPDARLQQWARSNPETTLGRFYMRRFGVAQPNYSQGSNNAEMSGQPQAQTNMPAGQPQGGGNNAVPNMSPLNVTSFAEGGLVTPQGAAIRPNAVMQTQSNPQLGVTEQPRNIPPAQLDREAQNFVQANPAEAQRIQAVMAHAMQTGELTREELNTAVQLARAALANPSGYAQIREYAIQNGLGSEQEIPVEFDQGLLFVLLVVGKSLQTDGAPSGNAMNGQTPAATQQPQAGLVPSYKDGGHTGDKGHLAMVHSDEYVIPKDALLYHGKKTFDALIQKAREPNDGQR